MYQRYISYWEIKMKVTKVFPIGRSQAVRLSTSFRFNCKEVAINLGRDVLLFPIENPWDIMLEAANEFESGFQLERVDPCEQFRKD